MNLKSLYDEAAGFHQRGNLAEAQQLYRQILAVEPDSFIPRHRLGVILAQQGRNAEALELIGSALKINPNDANALSHYGSILGTLGRFEEALASFEKALAIEPDFGGAHYNRGIVLRDMKRFEEALASFDAALKLRPGNAEILNHRAIALQNLKRFAQALADLDEALTINPTSTEILNNRGRLLFECNRVEEGLGDFRRSAALAYGTGAGMSGSVGLPHKARHDQEQQAYLSGNARSANLPEDGARLSTPAISANTSAGDIARQWQTGKPQIVVIDDFLTPDALEKLRRFCLGATVWRLAFQNGYLGALPEYGFACPLLAQIADELRSTYPAIFGSHPLRYLWAFKYDSQLSGVNIHADEAAVNVNFWITPDEANLDPEQGGLTIWDVAAPLDWKFEKYNNDSAAIRSFLARSGAKAVTIPYRANRAVIFDSDLFHETGKITFKDGYLNRRINVTLLYGRRE